MKTKQNKQSKLVIAMSAVILVLVALSATLTFAYFTAEKGPISSSELTFGSLAVNIMNGENAATSLTVSKEAHAVVPGCTLTMAEANKVKVTGNIDCYVRIKVDVTGPTDSGTTFAYGLSAESGSKWAMNQETESDKTVYYFYWNEKVTATESGVDLALNSIEITIPTSVGNDCKGDGITVSITAQAIQADHLMNGESAFSMSTFSAATLAGADAWDAFTA